MKNTESKENHMCHIFRISFLINFTNHFFYHKLYFNKRKRQNKKGFLTESYALTHTHIYIIHIFIFILFTVPCVGEINSLIHNAMDNQLCQNTQCAEEVFAACVSCQVLLCFKHFVEDDPWPQHNDYAVSNSMFNGEIWESVLTCCSEHPKTVTFCL